MKPRIYLAGPDVFRPDSRLFGDKLKGICAQHGLVGIFPSDGGAADPLASDILKTCIDHMDACAGIIANITPFRGASMDPGTAVEIGYALARKMSVVLWSEDTRTLKDRAAAYFNGDLRQLDTLRDPDGMLVEDLGLVENVMVAGAGGWQVHQTFDAAAKHMTTLQ